MDLILQETPNRVVVHVDLDCFYCQVEQKRLGIPRSQPCAVQQWQGLIAVNYAARALGVTRHMRVQEAVTTCPSLQCIHVEVLDENGSIDESAIAAGQAAANQPENSASRRGKACLQTYSRASTEIFAIFKRMFPKSVLEKASIDEAYFDITDAVTAKIEASNRDGSLSWERSLEEVAECSVVVGGSLMPGQELDGRLAIAARLTADLRGRVEHELDYTVSAGISHNKILSKIASAMNKPNNQTVVPVHAVAEVMSSLPLKKIRNFGGGVGQKLEALGCSTAADVQALSLSTLQQHFGSSAGWVARAARGISDEPVKPKTIPKSMLAAKSFGATSEWQVLLHWLKVLCSELAHRMQEDSNVHFRRPKNLVVHYRCSGGGGRFGAGQERSRSALLPTASLPSSEELVTVALKLLRSSPDVMPCNRVAVSTNVFIPMGSKAGSLSSMFSPKGKSLTAKPSCNTGSQPCAVPQAAMMGNAQASAVCRPHMQFVAAAAADSANVAGCRDDGAVYGEPAPSRAPGKRTLLQLMLPGTADAGGSYKAQCAGCASHRVVRESSVDKECLSWVARAGGDSMPMGAVRPCEHAHSDAGRHDWQSPERAFAWSEPVVAGLQRADARVQIQTDAFAQHANAPTDCQASGSGSEGVSGSAAACPGKGTAGSEQFPIAGRTPFHSGAVAVCTETSLARHDEPEGVDVAEQRRIFHLIQMEARDRKPVGHVPSSSVTRPAAKSSLRSGHKAARKQASILSLLNKK